MNHSKTISILAAFAIFLVSCGTDNSRAKRAAAKENQSQSATSNSSRVFYIDNSIMGASPTEMDEPSEDDPTMPDAPTEMDEPSAGDFGDYYPMPPATTDPGVHYIGCTDPAASNFDPSADFEDPDNPCTFPGCTNPLASNFNPDPRTVEDGTCVFNILGCTNPLASNFNPDPGTVEDGSCVFDVQGCTDSTALNYDLTATTDDGSCAYPVPGCTDATATNYDAMATVDDGSCLSFNEWIDRRNNSDDDGDGVRWVDDNCPDAYNPGQEDGDANGIGDACDLVF